MAYQELFNLLHEQYNITPIESEMNDIINVCRGIIAKENETPKSIYQVGDTVYHFYFGIGTVLSIESNSKIEFPVWVKFDTIYPSISFSVDGRYSQEHKSPSLSFTPYDLVNGGFSQERPKPEPKVGDWGYFWDTDGALCVFDCIDTILNNAEYK